ncbi:MAG: hypothetical protein QM756_34070 [Polyangiaceae bacterium]
MCETLHGLPATRKAACCARASAPSLLEECVRVLESSLKSGGVSVDPRRLGECQMAAERAFSGCDWVSPAATLPIAECEGVLLPQRAEGERCSSSLECQAPLHCDAANAAAVGRCRAPREVGAPCSASGDALAGVTLARSFESAHPLCRDSCSSVSHRCEPAPASGAACFASANCRVGQHCVDGRCVDGARSNDTATCRTDFDCARGGCVEDGETRRCGMKCSATPSALQSASTPVLRLPLRQKPGSR